ncbi:MAG: sigma-70 family RNA polymerase sigma factor [Candidatus Dadabacteria bacterium]|nr:sigma-70 family RNA polymerase sigma factor [Candidatus Dadabacteria bacterium]
MKLRQYSYLEEEERGLSHSFDEEESSVDFDPASDDEELSEEEERDEDSGGGGAAADRNYRLLFAYFSDLNKETLLTRRDEAVLAAKIKAAEGGAEKMYRLLSPGWRGKRGETRSQETLEALYSSYKSMSRHVQDKFIKSNLRLVIELANRFTGRGLPLTDLIQEGNIGLMKAVKKFDHTKGFKFSTYASWWINQSLSRAVMEQTHIIPIPVYLQELSAKVFKAKTRLERGGVERPHPEQIAEATGLPTDAVSAILRGNDLVIPLEFAPGDEESKTYLDITPDPNARMPEYFITTRSITEEVRSSLGLLSERERDIIKMRFGIGYNEDHKLDQIAGKYGLSRERVRQIEKEALTKLADSEQGRVLKGLLN